MSVSGAMKSAVPIATDWRRRGGELVGRQREGRVGLGDLDLRAGGERGEDRAGPARIDVSPVEALVLRLVGDEHEVDADVLAELGDLAVAQVIGEVDEDVIGIDADGGDGVGVELGLVGALVLVLVEVPGDGHQRDDHQTPPDLRTAASRLVHWPTIDR